MEDESATATNANRRTKLRSNVALEVEAWPLNTRRPEFPMSYWTRDVSMKGFYLLDDRPIDLPEKFEFALLFRKRSTHEKLTLMSGVAQIVRREQIPLAQTDEFGLAAKVESIRTLWDGEG